MFDRLYFNGYKSFDSNKAYMIDELKYVNVFIGKNNSGKSSVLNLLGVALADNCSIEHEKLKEFSLEFILTKEKMVNVSRSLHMNSNSFDRLVGKYCKVDILKNKTYQIVHFRDSNGNIYDYNNMYYISRIIEELPKIDKKMSNISAERNIVPECETLLSDGSGATNLIRKVITFKDYDEKLIERDLLEALNKIMGSDATFESIRVQEISKSSKNQEHPLWEIYLQEKNSARFALSQSGSGLKTIILVLLNLLVLPKLHPKETIVFGFEELENNLHPALQRRLFSYIYDYAIENKVYIFLTTHSHVAINLFFDKEEALIYHVTKTNQVSSIKKIDNYIDKIAILDDLDVKASDLLQANGIIWVEGPSDRIYIKRWLEVFGGSEVQEGTDFQFAYYGGKNLYHYSLEDIDGLINILLTNRNSAIVMDSDKKSRNDKVRDTKKRIEKEFNDKMLFSWITKGREIENYLSNKAIDLALDVKTDKQCNTYEKFPEYIEPYYCNFSGRKVSFANRVKDKIDNTNVLDLEKRIKELYKEIQSWNQ